MARRLRGADRFSSHARRSAPLSHARVGRHSEPRWPPTEHLPRRGLICCLTFPAGLFLFPPRHWEVQELLAGLVCQRPWGSFRLFDGILL